MWACHVLTTYTLDGRHTGLTKKQVSFAIATYYKLLTNTVHATVIC